MEQGSIISQMDERVEIFFMKTESKFLKKFDDSLKTRCKTLLVNYSWFNLGGNPEYFYKAKDKNQLIEFLKEAKEKKLKLTTHCVQALIHCLGIKG